MKSRFQYNTIPAAVRLILDAIIVEEGGHTDGKALGETFATMYGVTVKQASKRGPYGQYIASLVRSKALTRVQAAEYLYEFYYVPYRTHFDALIVTSPVLARLLLTSLVMGVGLSGARAPIDDWFRVVYAALQLRHSGAQYVLATVTNLQSQGRDVDKEIRIWLSAHSDLFLRDMRRSAVLQGKPVADGWANRIEKQIALYLRASLSTVQRIARTETAATKGQPLSDVGKTLPRIHDTFARVRGFFFGE